MEKEAKIEALGAKNFKKFSNIEVIFNSKVTRFVASNGEGKTTLGSQILLAALKGVAKNGDALIGNRWQFIGDNGKSADTWVKIRDTKANALVKFSNHITASKNEYTFELLEGPEGYVVDEKWFRSLMNASLLSANTFCSLSPKQQAVELGIDVSEHDTAIKEIKNEYTLLRRDLKAFGDLTPVNKIDKISIAELIKEKDEIEKHNQIQNEIIIEKKRINNIIQLLNDDIQSLKDDIIGKEKHLREKVKDLNSIPDPEKAKLSEIINAKIETADETNVAAEAYDNFIQKKTAKTNIQNKIDKNRTELLKEENKRKETIKEFKLPFDELNIDEDGGLVLKNRYITTNTFSSGELEVIVAKLAASTNPDFKVRFVDDIDLLDDEHQESLIKTLKEMGFQLIIASVRDTYTTNDENILHLKDAKIIN